MVELASKPEEAKVPRGSIAIELVGDASIPIGRLGLYWQSDSEDRSHGGSTECPSVTSGEFELKRVIPGTYTVWIQCRDGGWKPAKVEGVEVTAGLVTRDPRLLPLDLSGTVKFVQLKLVHAGGGALRNARVNVGVVGSGSSFVRHTNEFGDLFFAAPPDAATFELRLEKGVSIRVQVDDGAVPQEVIVPSN